jgi:hypothetical protein
MKWKMVAEINKLIKITSSRIGVSCQYLESASKIEF